MENLGTAIEKLMDKVLVIVGDCPECNGPMRKWKTQMLMAQRDVHLFAPFAVIEK